MTRPANQGYRRDLNLSETEDELVVIDNLGGAGIHKDLRLIQNNLRNTSVIGFSTITSDRFFNTGITHVIQITKLETVNTEEERSFTIELDNPHHIDLGHQVEIRNIKINDSNNNSTLNGFHYVSEVLSDEGTGENGRKYKFILPTDYIFDNPKVKVGSTKVRITPKDDFVFTNDDVVGLSTNVTFKTVDPDGATGTVTLNKGTDYYVCNSDGLSQFKLSYFPSKYSSADGTQVGIQTINASEIDYTLKVYSFTFIRKDIVIQDNLINFIKPEEEFVSDDDTAFRFFRSVDDEETTGSLNSTFNLSRILISDTKSKMKKRYEKKKDITSTKDIKYEGTVIVDDPDNYNNNETFVGNNKAGVFIGGTRAFSADNNPWDDEDPDASNALVTKSEQVSISEIVFDSDIRIDGLGSDIGTVDTTAGAYTHKVPIVVNGETYFLLVVAN